MEAQVAEDPRIGMVLQDRYRILRKLGDGGMGAVYEGEHIVIKRKVAVKALHAQFAQNPEIAARFRREAEAATAIGHPNIVEVTDMGQFPDGTAYMVLELLNGRDWSHDIDHQGPQPLGKVVHIVSQVCDAVAAAHAKGIVHRDLKPENIFLIERGGDPNFVKVVDFGISKVVDPSSQDRSLTQTGTALGTPYYMAPEQCQGKKDLDARADIYALGVILFQALTGQYPFDDESYPMLVLKICTETPPPIDQYRPDLPPDVCATIYCMLAKDREARFASIEEVKAALAPYRHVHDAPVVVEGPSTASRGPSVLEARTGSTPNGTAYLPTAPAAGTSAAALPVSAEPPSSKRGLAIAGVLGGLLVVGAVGGTAALLAARSGDDGVVSADERPARTDEEPARAEPAGARGVPEPVPSVEPAQRAPEQPAEPGRATVRITVTVDGPPSAEMYVDGVHWGSAPLEMDVPRADPPAPGEQPELHTIEARAEGWRNGSVSFPYLVGMTRAIRMERERPGTRRPGGTTSAGEAPTTEVAERRPVQERTPEERTPERPPTEERPRDRPMLDPFSSGPAPTKRQPILDTRSVLGN